MHYYYQMYWFNNSDYYNLKRSNVESEMSYGYCKTLDLRRNAYSQYSETVVFNHTGVTPQIEASPCLACNDAVKTTTA